MRLLLSLAALLMLNQTIAQENTNVTHTNDRVIKNAIGIQAGAGFGYTEDDEIISLQYKRWVRPNRAVRISAGFGKYDNMINKGVTNFVADTAIETLALNTVDMFYVNAGIEMHKQFYKRMYMYAAIDLRAGYGSGTVQHAEKRHYSVGGVTYKEESYLPFTTTFDLTRFTIDATPYVGVKVLFNRVAFGTEISALRTGFISQKTTDPTEESMGIVDMNAGLLRQRIFINFRF